MSNQYKDDIPPAYNTAREILEYLLWKYPDHITPDDVEILFCQIEKIVTNNYSNKTYWQRFKEWIYGH